MNIINRLSFQRKENHLHNNLKNNRLISNKFNENDEKTLTYKSINVTD